MRPTLVLLAVLLTCLVSAANCSDDEGGDVVNIPAGSLRRRSPEGEKMVGSSEIHVILCVKSQCTGPTKTCYCCMLLPPDDSPCFSDQQECWRLCPKLVRLRKLPSGNL
ncbi:hypothetical protein SORBI_3004G090100 [Sorghum bicolor]|uniref:Embryo surrounding factor 1 brassicaceae domain-containing protein n=1 Tax=Sorghum bicolor TaxID=4558 RepID=A0A194YNH7_SORBI|nr:hypothetical protein SORBI_3004G090100 [Sorghum bicolor]